MSGGLKMSYAIVSANDKEFGRKVLSKDLTMLVIGCMSNCSEVKFFESLQDAQTTLESAHILKNFNAVDFEIMKAKPQQGILKLKEVMYTQTSEDTKQIISDLSNIKF